MLPSMPLDVLITILNSLPATRSSYDIGPRTLSACLQVNSLLREAASVPYVWKLHYLIRYEHCNKLKELARRRMCQDNWHLMYQERRRVDVSALKKLDRLILIKQDRQKMMASIVESCMDVWDALELETQHPIPWALDPIQSSLFSSEIPEHALTRRYWAKCLLDTISRGWAIEKWNALSSESNDYTNASSFEECMTTLSCFFGASPQRITAELERLANECRLHMLSHKVIVDSQHPDYCLVEVCKEICTFMFQSGFGRYVDDHFSFDILNNFPHAYLSTNKRTLPISLVHIFVAICSRLSIRASPINFPGTVLAHVEPADPTKDAIYINPSAADHDVVVTLSSPVITRFNTTPQTITRFLTPCNGLPMLVRASRNILGMAVSRADGSPYIDHSAILVPLCTHMIFTSDRRTVSSLLDIFKLDPMDIIFLQQHVLPLLTGSLWQHLQSYCQAVLDQEEETEAR
ncbi:hypothetical protein BJ165DRAFT_477418 [Panaeolus papilionaceus]|nr:hypothetical protein BJ165DRAFT_477418 [Panaeolus papilionaceus]